MFNLLFACSHKNVCWPRTPRQPPIPEAAKPTGSYLVCLDCGREFPFDVKQWRVVREADCQAQPTALIA